MQINKTYTIYAVIVAIALYILTTFTIYLFRENVYASGNADIDFGGHNVIGRYHYGKYDRTVANITQWQYDIMRGLGIPFKTMLYLKTVQNLECGNENGFCLNTSDCGPIQINQIHEEYKWCKKMVTNGNKEIEKAKKTDDWSKVIEIRDELYESQIYWTWKRMQSQVIRFDLSIDREKRMYSLAKLHNGSKHKIQYAEKAVITYGILRDYYTSLGLK